MSDEREWYERLLDLQLEANPLIWRQMQDLGVDEQTQMRLAFIFLAPGEAEGRRLVEFLRTETDYDVELREKTARRPAREWLVLGATQPTTLSLETLDAWVEWMVAAGA